MVFSIIQKFQLEGTHRMDAEYYQPKYLILEKSLNGLPHEALQNISIVSGGKRLPVGEEFSDKGIPYLRIMDIFNTFIDFSGVKFISEKLHILLNKYQIRNKDILVTIVGNTTGLIGYNQTNIRPFNFTENCARIRSKNYLPEYLLVVLSSKIGQLQIEREKVGAAQPKLSLERLRKLQIPSADENFQILVQEFVSDSLDFYVKSENIRKEAEKLLLEELGLSDFQVPDDVSYIVNFSDLTKSHRMDAEFFQPKFEKFSSQILRNNAKPLGDLVSMKKGIEPGSEAYQEEGKLFIRVSSLSKNGIEDKDQKNLNEDLYNKLKPSFKPKIGEILLTKDATPGIAYVLKEPVEGIISGGILRLKTKEEIDPEFLALCINSIVGQMQVERDAGGSIIAHWRPEQIKNILIPVMPVAIQYKISDLVRQSHEARKKSKVLLEQAKREVEEMIEKRSESYDKN